MCVFYLSVTVDCSGNGDDYTSNSIIAIFPPGATNATINVPVTDDDIVEGTELFNLEISIERSSRENAMLGNRKTATGIIIDSTG